MTGCSAAGREETLLALFVLVAFLFTMMGILELAGRASCPGSPRAFRRGLDARVFSAALGRSSLFPGDSAAATGLRDLESIRQLLSSPVF